MHLFDHIRCFDVGVPYFIRLDLSPQRTGDHWKNTNKYTFDHEIKECTTSTDCEHYRFTDIITLKISRSFDFINSLVIVGLQYSQGTMLLFVNPFSRDFLSSVKINYVPEHKTSFAVALSATTIIGEFLPQGTKFNGYYQIKKSPVSVEFSKITTTASTYTDCKFTNMYV